MTTNNADAGNCIIFQSPRRRAIPAALLQHPVAALKNNPATCFLTPRLDERVNQ